MRFLLRVSECHGIYDRESSGDVRARAFLRSLHEVEILFCNEKLENDYETICERIMTEVITNDY